MARPNEAATVRANGEAMTSATHTADEYDLTGVQTHRATQRGYVAGQLIGPDDETSFVPPGVPVSEEWMEPVAAKDRKLMKAVEEATDEHPKDADLTALNKSALQAMAAERGINVDGLTKEDLITAIKAEREPTI